MQILHEDLNSSISQISVLYITRLKNAMLYQGEMKQDFPKVISNVQTILATELHLRFSSPCSKKNTVLWYAVRVLLNTVFVLQQLIFSKNNIRWEIEFTSKSEH